MEETSQILFPSASCLLPSALFLERGIENRTSVTLLGIADQFCNYFPSRIALKKHIQEIIEEAQTFKHCLSEYGISNFIYFCKYVKIELTKTEKELLQYYWSISILQSDSRIFDVE
jgi:hypothetical protein